MISHITGFSSKRLQIIRSLSNKVTYAEGIKSLNNKMNYETLPAYTVFTQYNEVSNIHFISLVFHYFTGVSKM